LERQLLAVKVANPKARKVPEHLDWLHLNAHRAQHRDYFLTRDGPMLFFADEIAECGVQVMLPADYLAWRGSGPNESPAN
jgi:hypothetical protein